MPAPDITRRFPCLLILLLLALPAVAQETAETLTVAKSPNDRREYRALVLENGLRVLLISDPGTDKAAASLDVDSGSNRDPEAWPGLAHFLEHMLFLGTEKYPRAGEYQEFISSHGGGHNAYTAFENTNYYFDIEKSFLEGGLDRFAQFFIAPLFSPEYVDRERNAVHSEYQSNLQDDGRRAYSVFKQVINPAHPLSRFSVGSLDTLRDQGGVSLREALLRHYDENYSANLMSLAVLGAESLDGLEELVRRHFSAVPNRALARPATDEPLFRDGELPARLAVLPVRDLRTLSYTFPVPPVHAHYRAKPLSYLANLLGHEGEGSLLALLRARGWVNALSAGAGMSYRDNATFSVNLSLTEAGVQHVDEIGALVFQAIRLIRDAGVHGWLYEEQRRMAETGFLFQEPSRPIGYVSSLSRRLQEYPPAEVLTAPYAYENFDPALIREYLSFLRPDNVLVTVTHKGVEAEQADPLFGGEYAFGPLAPALVEDWTGGEAEPALAIPAPNPFLPEDLSLEAYQGPPSPGGPADKPRLVLDEGGVRLWFKQDNEFRVPRANFHLYAMAPLYEDSLRHSLLTSFVVSLLNDKLNEYSYPANLAGLFYGVSRGARGFTISLGGYEDKQALLLEEVLRTLAEADFAEERFAIIKAEMLRGWRNAPRQSPYSRLYQKAQALLIDPYWSEEERIAEVADITLEEVIAFVPRMLDGVTIDALYHGNVLEEDAHAMLEIVGRHLKPSGEVERPPFSRVVKLEPGSRTLLEVVVEHDDSAIVAYRQGPDDSLETRASVNLLAAILRTPFYDSLRTEKQLGYVVNLGAMALLNVSGLVMTIESPSAHPLVLQEEIEAFLAGYEEALAAMPAQMFEDIKAGLLNNLRQDPQRLDSLSSRFWSDIVLEEYEADSTLRMAEVIESLSHEDVLAWYRRHVVGEEARSLVAWSVGRPRLAEFAALRGALPPDMRVVRDAPQDFAAFKTEAELYHYRGAEPLSE